MKLRRLAVGDATAGKETVANSARERVTEKLERMMHALQSNQEGGSNQGSPGS